MTDRHNVAFVLLSAVLSGAEKRFVRMFVDPEARRFNAHLILNASLFAQVKANPEFADKIARPTKIRCIHVIPERRLLNKRFLSYLRLLLALPAIRKVVKAQQISVCHVPVCLELAGMIGMLGVPVVFEITSPDIACKCSSRSKTLFARYISKAVAVSPSVRKAVESSNTGSQMWSRKIITAPTAFYREQNLNATSYLREKDRLVVFACRLIERKNPVLFARCAKAFLAKFPEWKVAILGDGPQKSEICSILRSEIDKNQVIAKRVSAMDAYLQRCLIFVSIIQQDNYPSQSVLEAMDYESTLVLSDRGDSCRFIYNGNGRLVELDEESVALALCDLASDFATSQRRGRESKACLAARFSPETYFNHLQELYSSMSSN